MRVAVFAGTLGLLAGPAYAQTGVVLQGEGPLAGATLRLDQRLALRYYVLDDRLPDFQDLPVLNYVEEVGRTNLMLSKSHFAMGAQIDQVALFANRYILDGDLHHERLLYEAGVQSPFSDAYFNVDKLFARHQGSDLEVLLGDGYASFGNGIALNLVKNSDIDVDTSLRGVKGVIRQGPWAATVLTGVTNPQQVQQDNRNLGIGPDLHHMISGLRFERSEIGPVTVGTHGVVYRFARAADPCGACALERYTEPLDAAVGGVTAEAYGVAGLDIIAEADGFSYASSDLFGGASPEAGYGMYGSASGYPGRFVVLAEVKRYFNGERLNTWPSVDGFEVSVPPTLEYERVITEDSAATVNSNDVAGFRVKVQHSTIPGILVPYVSLSGFRDWDTAGLHFNSVPESIVHPMVGLQWTEAEWHLLANTGFRCDLRDGDAGADTLVHGDIDISVPAGALGSVELATSFKRFGWGRNAQQQQDFTEVENALSLHAGEHWVYVLYQDFSNNPLIDSEGNIAEDIYGAGEVQYKPGSALTLAAFAGAYKAGIRCSGGQCRSLPGFEGVRLTMSGTF